MNLKDLRRERFEAHPDAKEILGMFIEWANEYEKDAPLRLKYEDFFSDQFDLTVVDADLVLPSGRYMFLTVGDGGEGGPTNLVAFWDRPLAGDGWELMDITMRFDLDAQIIWKGGEYVHSS